MNENQLIVLMFVLVGGIFLFNSFLQFQLNSQLAGLATGTLSATTTPATSSRTVNDITVGEKQALLDEIIPRGTPAVYGSELGVSFDSPVESLAVLSKLDGDLYPDGKIKFASLNPTQQQRYIDVGSRISCEFCCGARTMTQKNGQPACGCAHSAAMRGLALYLLQNHEDAYTNAQILDELTKWKTLFFPKQMVQKALKLKAAQGQIDATSLNELPAQVGGC